LALAVDLLLLRARRRFNQALPPTGFTKNMSDVDQREHAEEFERQASQRQRGILGEFLDFLVHNKKWWLTPIILVLLLLAVLVILGGTGAAPFIYPLF
jgi:hypothetical protein